jgi:hypothetical protein
MKPRLASLALVVSFALISLSADPQWTAPPKRDRYNRDNSHKAKPMSQRTKARVFSRKIKLLAVKRMLAGGCKGSGPRAAIAARRPRRHLRVAEMAEGRKPPVLPLVRRQNALANRVRRLGGGLTRTAAAV